MAVHEPIHHNRDRDDRVVVTPTEARQGMLGRPVLYVLVIGLVLAMLAWAAAEYWGMAIDTQTPSDALRLYCAIASQMFVLEDDVDRRILVTD